MVVYTRLVDYKNSDEKFQEFSNSKYRFEEKKTFTNLLLCVIGVYDE